MNKIVFALMFGLNVFPRAIFADDRHVTLPPLTKLQREALSKSINTHIPLEIESSHPMEKVDASIAGFFAGSVTKVQLNISDLILKFKRNELLSDPESPNEYTVALTTDIRFITLLHSAPYNPADSVGVRMRVNLGRDMRTKFPYIRGKGETSFYLAVPSFTDVENAWGIYVCPRRVVATERPKEKGYYDYSLEASPFRLTSAKFSVSGVANATLATAGTVGRSEIKLQTSPEIPPAINYHDDVTSTEPDPAVEYHPEKPFNFFEVSSSPGSAYGVLATVMMQSKVGNVKREFFLDNLFVGTEPAPTAARLVAEGHRIKSDSGDCYSVVLFRDHWKEFTHETANF